jgi:hypothetical protein
MPLKPILGSQMTQILKEMLLVVGGRQLQTPQLQ